MQSLFSALFRSLRICRYRKLFVTVFFTGLFQRKVHLQRICSVTDFPCPSFASPRIFSAPPFALSLFSLATALYCCRFPLPVLRFALNFLAPPLLCCRFPQRRLSSVTNFSRHSSLLLQISSAPLCFVTEFLCTGFSLTQFFLIFSRLSQFFSTPVLSSN